jgi:hypothetical protein
LPLTPCMAGIVSTDGAIAGTLLINVVESP